MIDINTSWMLIDWDELIFMKCGARALLRAQSFDWMEMACKQMIAIWIKGVRCYESETMWCSDQNTSLILGYTPLIYRPQFVMSDRLWTWMSQWGERCSFSWWPECCLNCSWSIFEVVFLKSLKSPRNWIRKMREGRRVTIMIHMMNQLWKAARGRALNWVSSGSNPFLTQPFALSINSGCSIFVWISDTFFETISYRWLTLSISPVSVIIRITLEIPLLYRPCYQRDILI